MSVTHSEAASDWACGVLPAPFQSPDTDTSSPASLRPGFTARLTRLLTHTRASLHMLAEQPFAFWLGLLALNALAVPYGGFLQDARLYAFQVQNVLEDGRHAHDLFFLYGSQDRYSVFSTVAAPLVQVLDIPTGFFLLYLLGIGLYLHGVQRLVRALLADKALAALATVAIAVTRLPFGGCDTFCVGENFLTPRLFGIALVLFGLDRMLLGRSLAAVFLLGAALAVHPLMAIGGVLIFLGYCMLHYLTRAQVATVLLAGSVAVLVVLAYPPLGTRLLGSMDAEWFEAVRRANPYQVPARWNAADWLRIAVAFATLGAALSWITDHDVRRFLLVLLVVVGLGLAGTVVACWLSYTLPIQAQPYRVLWLLQLVQVPLGFFLIARWWNEETPSRRFAAVLLLGWFAVESWDLLPLVPLVITVGVFLLWHRSAPANAESAAGVLPAVVGLGLGLAIWLAIHLTIVLTHWHQLDGLIEPLEYARSWSSLLSPLARVMLLGAGLLLLHQALGTGARFQATALAVCLAVQVSSFALPFLPSYRARFRPSDAHLVLVKDYLNAHPTTQARTPTVYWPMGRMSHIEHVWLDLRVNNYVDWAQLSGNSFHRGTAIEGQRRVNLVKRFEIDNNRRFKILMRPLIERSMQDIFQAPLDEPPPTREDLIRLCQDEHVDFLVLRQQFDGLFAATNGHWFIYDCRNIRSALAKQQPATVAPESTLGREETP